MKSIVTIVATLMLVILLSVGFVWHQVRAQKAEVILVKLRDGKGDRNRLMMKLQLARGDVTGKMIDAYGDPAAGSEFRQSLLELLARRQSREQDDRIEELVIGAMKDSDRAVRGRAAYCIAAYMDWKPQRVLIDCVTDEEPRVRKQAYMLLLTGQKPRSGSLWALELNQEYLTDEDRLAIVNNCKLQMERETDPTLKFLAASVVGRQVGCYVDDSMQAAGGGDLARAEELLNKALEFAPANQRAQIAQVRWLMRSGKEKEAIELADKYGALLRVPKLPEMPTIDGDPTDPVWQKALKVGLIYHTTSNWEAKHCEGKSDAFIGHIDGKICITVIGYENPGNIDKLVVKHTSRDSNVWEDDCVEIFFDPEGVGECAYQVILNAGGALYDSYKVDRKHNFAIEHKARIFRDRGYWSIEFAIPAAELNGSKLSAVKLWGLNIARARIGPASEHCMIWPGYGQALNYHNHPVAVFEGAAEDL